jgi:hypothetical protein
MYTSKSRLTRWGFDQKYKKRATSISRLANEQAPRFEDSSTIPPRRKVINSIEDQRLLAKALKESSDLSMEGIKPSYQDDGFATGADEPSHPASSNTWVESNGNGML